MSTITATQALVVSFRKEVQSDLTGTSCRGYLSALTEIEYACSVGETELTLLLRFWQTFIPLNEFDMGYVNCCRDMADALTELNFLEEWSNYD